MAVLPDPARSEAVLIGAHEYTSLEDLPAVANNLRGLREVLTDPAVWGLPKEQCTVLSQPDGPPRILEAVRRAAGRARDTLLVYYAGHGLSDPYADELHLALPGSQRDAEYTWLRYEYLRRAVLGPSAGARRSVVVLDCCYSGRALVGHMSASEQIADHAMVDGTCLLTASAETRTALAPPGEEYTAFSGELIAALSQGIPGGPDLIDMNSLYRHLHRVLAAKSRPLPQQRNRNTGGLIALARNRAVPHRPGRRPDQNTQDDPDAQRARYELAHDLAKSGRHVEAARLFREVAEGRARVLGDDDIDTLVAWRSYAHELEAAGEHLHEAEGRVGLQDRQVEETAATARAALAAAGSSGPAIGNADESEATEALDRLVGVYVELRRTAPSGPARTGRQERVFDEMLDVVPRIRDSYFDSMLTSENAGRRLAAIAHLYCKPEPGELDSLVEMTTSEQLPFLVYWALITLGRLVEESGRGQVPHAVVERLRAFAPTLPAHSDRAHLLRTLLAKFDPPSES